MKVTSTLRYYRYHKMTYRASLADFRHGAHHGLTHLPSPMDRKLNFVSLEVEGGIRSPGRGAKCTKPAMIRGERLVSVTLLYPQIIGRDPGSGVSNGQSEGMDLPSVFTENCL